MGNFIHARMYLRHADRLKIILAPVKQNKRKNQPTDDYLNSFYSKICQRKQHVRDQPKSDLEMEINSFFLS